MALAIAPAIHLGAQCGPKIELATVKFGPYPGYGGPFSSVTGKVSLYSDGDGVQACFPSRRPTQLPIATVCR